MTTVDFRDIHLSLPGPVASKALIDTRNQLHHAVQIVASIGYTFRNPRPDWSHVSLEWDSRLGALTNPMDTSEGAINSGLRIADLTLVSIDSSGAVQATFPLTGRTLEEGYSWLAELVTSHGVSELVRPDHDIPNHPVYGGSAFDPDPAALQAYHAHFSNARDMLSTISARTLRCPSVRCWPHHFDIATLIKIDQGANPEEARSVGIGFSPGDDKIETPYWYILPWPAPDPDDLPEFSPEGNWNTCEWVGAVLKSDDIYKCADPAAVAAKFIEFGIVESLKVLNADPLTI